MNYFFFLLCLPAIDVFGQAFSPAPYLGMGQVSLAQEGLYALAGNPAGLQGIAGLEVAAAYQQHYFLPDVASQGLFLGMPISSASRLGLRLNSYGIFQVRSFVEASIVWSRAFGKNFAGSVSLNHHADRISKYSTARNFSLDLGLRYKWDSTLSFGLFYKNAAGHNLGTLSTMRIEQELGFGLSYCFSELLLFGADLLRLFPDQMLYKVGLAFVLHPAFTIRVGTLGSPMQYTAGFGIKQRRWYFDMASNFHSKLGSSPQLAIRYAF